MRVAPPTSSTCDKLLHVRPLEQAYVGTPDPNADGPLSSRHSEHLQGLLWAGGWNLGDGRTPLGPHFDSSALPLAAFSASCSPLVL